MSLIARCPACQTLFKVVPDQLRISEGWVRCGSCEAVFDASLHLLADTVETGTEVSLEADAQPLAVAGDIIDAAPEAAQVSPDQTLPLESDNATTDSDPQSAETNIATFLNLEPATTRRKNPLRHFALTLLCVALFLGLAGQIVLHERDRIVALQPALKPWLVALCLPLKCQVSALRQKDAIAIDRASFSKIAGNSYRLNFTVRNTATVPVAAPSIELTLTDTSDQPVLRRVFLHTELDFKSDTLSAAEEWSSSLVVAADLTDTAQQTVGYRIYAFYP
jgi:predicted Zn finger-like uncharacterized protein